MKKYLYTILLLTMGISLWASPLHSKLKHSIIIDTDCNDSDLRAISILLSHPGITIKAILLSDGYYNRENGIKKIRNLLHHFNGDSIRVYTGTGMTKRLFIK